MSFKFSVIGIWCVLFSFSAVASFDDKRPEYQKEYDAYMRDLAIIAQTGKAPKNLKLEADLAKMDSDEKIRLTSRKPDNTRMESAKLSRNDIIVTAQISTEAEVVNSIEIIRIPEEFRDNYSDSIISAQDLADSQKSKKKIIIDEDTMKVADHINPFRFLSEVKLSPLSGDYGTQELPLNPMVNAYFNQFGRPYVAETSKSIIKKTKAEKTNAKKTSVNSLSLRNSMFVD